MPAFAPVAVALDAAPFRLRPYAETDVPLFASLFTDPVVMRELSGPYAADRADRAAAASLRHQQAKAGRFLYWVIEHAEDTAGLLGLALGSENWAGGEADLGVLLWPAWQARGAGTAAVLAVRPWAFDVAGLAVLTAHHAETNAAAAAWLRRAGFSPCAPRAGAPLPVGWECRSTHFQAAKDSG